MTKTVLLVTLASVIMFFLGGLSAISSMPKAAVVPTGSYVVTTQQIGLIQTGASNFGRIADSLSTRPDLKAVDCELGNKMLSYIPELQAEHFQLTQHIQEDIQTIKETCESNISSPSTTSN